MEYKEIERARKYLSGLGLRAVYVPRQDGWREHFALLDDEDFPVYAVNSALHLVKEIKDHRDKVRALT